MSPWNNSLTLTLEVTGSLNSRAEGTNKRSLLVVRLTA